MNEMMDMLMMLSENGYDFEDLTFDDFVRNAKEIFAKKALTRIE